MMTGYVRVKPTKNSPVTIHSAKIRGHIRTPWIAFIPGKYSRLELANPESASLNDQIPRSDRSADQNPLWSP